MVNNDVYTRDDLNNLYLENLNEVKETHIRCAVAFIKRRILAAAAEWSILTGEDCASQGAVTGAFLITEFPF